MTRSRVSSLGMRRLSYATEGATTIWLPRLRTEAKRRADASASDAYRHTVVSTNTLMAGDHVSRTVRQPWKREVAASHCLGFPPATKQRKEKTRASGSDRIGVTFKFLRIPPLLLI